MHTYSRQRIDAPYFSICIPQYNRTSFLLKLLQSLDEQTFDRYEVCISDDRSPDGRQDEVIKFLESSTLSYSFQVQPVNRRYDGNLRAALGLAQGTYCFLMGNDDALAGPDTLSKLKAKIERHGPADVVITDFEEYATEERANRIQQTKNYGSGPGVAAGHFRNFSFVSGVLLARDGVEEFATDAWDGSEMYQTYLGCRMIASGRNLLELEDVTVRSDIQIEGEEVDSYATREKDLTIKERRLPLSQLGRVVADAISPYTTAPQQRTLNEEILQQLLTYTIPFWLVEYRRVQSWRYSLGLALGMRPAILAKGLDLTPIQHFRIRGLYLATTIAGLLLPLPVFDALQSVLYQLAKSPRE